MSEAVIIQRNHRVPTVEGPAGDGSGPARQLDAALLGVGFKASQALLTQLSGLDREFARERATMIVAAVREMVGEHQRHNSYFIDFPAGVPDTVAFWLRCLKGVTPADALPGRKVNLLALPLYGRYQHTYEELLDAHKTIIPSIKDRVTILHLGGTYETELRELYLTLAGSSVPLKESDLGFLDRIASEYAGDEPDEIPIRENRALLNKARLVAGLPLLADTVTDILRVACALSDGDVSLNTSTRFRSLPRARRKALLTALDTIVEADPAKLNDVNRYRERWKRLAERLHPHEFELPHALDVFAVAYRQKTAHSLAARAEIAFARGDRLDAVSLLAKAPGLLFRSLDRVLRNATSDETVSILDTLRDTAAKVSGRVLLSLREHLDNRLTPDALRIFINQAGRAWVAEDARTPLDETLVRQIQDILTAEVASRLPAFRSVVVDPDMLDVALPLTGKSIADGLGVLPRGSVLPVDGESLRFFIYWREKERRTDFDLSVFLLDEQFEQVGHLSWTRLQELGAVHSGDITESAEGASEFIDLDLGTVKAAHIVPSVMVYEGEGYDEVAESFFGYMLRSPDQQGLPFEPRTVRSKSSLRGNSRVAYPLLFSRTGTGWEARWLHLFVKGANWGNRVETSRVSSALLAYSIAARDYLTVRTLVDLLPTDDTGPAAYFGLDHPEGLAPGTEVFTPDRLTELIPE